MEKINFKIATPERVVFRGEVDSITLPTRSGEITILPNHIPLISVLKAGEIVVREGKGEFNMSVSGGFVEVLSTKVVVLADRAEKSDEIDVERAENAIKRAEELRNKKTVDSMEFATLTAKIEKELARVRVGRKHSKRIDHKASGVNKY